MNQVTEQSRPTVDEPDRPTPEEIERRAYKIYDERGPANGNDMEDWLRAETSIARGIPER